MKIPKSLKLESDNYILRIPNEEDIPYIFSATKTEGFNDGMQWDAPKKEEELIIPLKNNIRAWETGEGFSFTIIEKGLSSFLGRISIRKTASENIWDTGFWTHPNFQRKGVMTESLEVVLTFGFEVLSAKRIEACHALWNKASEKVLQKNGMTFDRHIEKGFKKNGIWVSENLLAINKRDWEINRNSKNE